MLMVLDSTSQQASKLFTPSRVSADLTTDMTEFGSGDEVVEGGCKKLPHPKHQQIEIAQENHITIPRI